MGFKHFADILVAKEDKEVKVRDLLPSRALPC